MIQLSNITRPSVLNTITIENVTLISYVFTKQLILSHLHFRRNIDCLLLFQQRK